MRSYFHCSTAKFRRRRSVALVLVGSVCAESAVISFIVMFFGIFGSGVPGNDLLVRVTLTAAAAFCIAGPALCFLAASYADKRSARHSRYTYLDIQLKFAVISVYSGEMRILGRNEVFRELYVIPFKEFVSAKASRDGKKLVIRGKMRRYGMESDFLGYHIRKGDIEFDRMWLNVGSFEEIEDAELPSYFGDPVKIAAVIMEAKKRFDEIPKPQKHVPPPKPAVRRPIRRVLPDEPDFSRSWK